MRKSRFPESKICSILKSVDAGLNRAVGSDLDWRIKIFDSRCLHHAVGGVTATTR